MSEMLPPLVLEMRSRFGSVIADLKGVDTAVANTERAANSSTSGIERSFKRAAAAGKILTVGLIGAGLVVGGVSLKMASDFQAHMTLLRTAAGETASGVKVVSNGILDLAGSTGTTIDQLSQGAYTVEKAGFRGASALQVLKAAAEGAKAENVDLATSTNALTSVMMSYHLGASKAVSVENEMVAASGLAKTTMQEFAGSLSTVIPVASAAGISFAQVGGAIATLTQHGTSADEATQELSNTIRGLQAPNQVAQKAMQQLGLNVVDVESHLGQRGLTGTIDLITKAITSKMGPSGQVIVDAMRKSQSATADLQEELHAMPSSLASLSKQFEDGSLSYKQYYTAAKALGGQQYEMAKGFITTMGAAKGFNNLLTSGSPAAQTFAGYLKQVMGGATGMNTALMLGGENMKFFTSATREVGDAAGKSGKDISTWTLTQQNLNVQIAQMRDSVDAAMVRLGTALIPTVSAAVKVMMGFAVALAKNKPLLIGIGMAVAAIVGPLMAMYIAQKAVAAGMAIMRAATLLWAAAQAILNAAMDANPIGLIILGIAALIAVIVLLVTHWSQVTQFLQQAWTNVCNWFVQVGAQLWKWWNGFWNGLVDFLKKWGVIILSVIAPFIGLPILIAQHWNQITAWWDGLWQGIFNTIQSIAGSIGSWMTDHLWNPIIDGINTVLSALQPLLAGLKAITGGAVNITIPKVPRLPSYDVGGVIPGAKGAPMPILAHGGEVMLSHAMLAGQQPVPTAAQTALSGRGGQTIQVFAQTNASPMQIASTVGWELRRRG